MLSTSTLYFIASFLIGLTGGLTLAIFHEKEDRSARYWTYACCSLSLGWFCLGFRSIAPDWVGYSAAFFFIMYSYFLSSKSIHLLVQSKSDWKFWQIGYCAFFALGSWVLVFTNNPKWIVPATSIGFIGAAMYAARITAQVRKKIPSRFITAMQNLFIATAIFWGIRLAAADAIPIYPDVDSVWINWVSLFTFLAMSLLRNFTYIAIRLSDSYQQQITQIQIHLEKSLESLHLAAACFKCMSDSIMMTDTNGKIIQFNESLSHFYGFTKENARFQNIADLQEIVEFRLQNGEVLPLDQWLILRALQGKTGVGVQLKVNRKDINRSWIGSFNFSPIRDDTNVIIGAVVTASDITERVRIATEQNAILNSRISGIAKLKNRRFIWANDYFLTSFGYSSEELLGKTSEFLYPNKEQYLVFGEKAYPALQNGEIFRDQFQLKHKDGSLRWFDLSGALLDSGKDESIWLSIDITEKKSLESERIHYLEEMQIAAIAFETQEGVIIADHKRTIQRVNNAFMKMTGYSAEDVVGKPAQMLASSRYDQDFYDAINEGLKNQDTWQGEIYQQHKNGKEVPIWLTISVVKNEAGIINHHVATFTDLSDRKQSQAAIHKLTNFDTLTNLPNRQAFLQQLHKIIDSDSKLHSAIFHIDLDRFNLLNDTFGFDVGDLLLQKVAKRLTKFQSAKGYVARLGGDEFAVVVDHLSENLLNASEEVYETLTNVQRIFNTPFQLQTRQYKCEVSIGIALFSGKVKSPEELLKQAEIAMYQSKNAGRNTASYFDDKMQTRLIMRSSVESDLRAALVNHQFRLHYQAQVDENLKVVGVEALIRLDHPTRGMIYPGDFIDVAEDFGLIEPIGDWVLENVCNQLNLWSKVPALSHLIIAVNVSARQFANTDFVKNVFDILDRAKANPALLKIEPTESVLLNDVDGAINKMNALKNIGVRFALDDFGTGYSSLSYLRKLPLSQLKIDQSFVKELPFDLNACSIVRSIIGLGHNLNLKIIAEGVENEDQRNYLAKYGCDFFQGYFFSKPIPVSDFERLMLDYGGHIHGLTRISFNKLENRESGSRDSDFDLH